MATVRFFSSVSDGVYLARPIFWGVGSARFFPVGTEGIVLVAFICWASGDGYYANIRVLLGFRNANRILAEVTRRLDFACRFGLQNSCFLSAATDDRHAGNVLKSAG